MTAGIGEALRAMLDRSVIAESGPAIQALLHSRIVKQYSDLRYGGSGRGMTWAPFRNPWYTRRDGTQVPIWGGVPKARGEGLVKGRLRSKNPEGAKRYTQRSNLMQSTGMLKAALLSDLRISERGIELITPIRYAAAQNALREWNYITDGEAGLIGSIIERKLRERG